MAFSNRTYGVEIECVGINNVRNMESILKDAGLTVGPNGWMVKNDYSVRNGLEVVSPVLKGKNGFQKIKKVCAALAANGVTIDLTCGLHVHVGVSDFKAKELANILFRYSAFETELDKIMTRDRRGKNNYYCESLSYLKSKKVQNDILKDTDETIFNGWRFEDWLDIIQYERSSKVNLHAYPRQGTVEFRQHGGTVSSDKIVNWVQFCVNFVEMSRLNQTTESQAHDIKKSPYYGLSPEVISYFQERRVDLGARKTPSQRDDDEYY